MANTNYGIIHEVGEYQDVIPLSEDENELVNKNDEKTKSDKNSNN